MTNIEQMNKVYKTTIYQKGFLITMIHKNSLNLSVSTLKCYGLSLVLLTIIVDVF